MKEMSNLYNLKKYVKEQANLIQISKKELKTFQKENSGWDNGRFDIIKNLSKDYRHHHIAYSLLKGIPYESIEQPKENNAPDMDLIKEIQDAYTSQDVCACQK
jgi:hypothetical protein